MAYEDLMDAVCEDIGYHFKDSKAYGYMCERLPQHAIDHHLAKWIRSGKRVSLTAESIVKLGYWRGSPQGYDFWDALDDVVERGIPLHPGMYAELMDLR